LSDSKDHQKAARAVEELAQGRWRNATAMASHVEVEPGVKETPRTVRSTPGSAMPSKCGVMWQMRALVRNSYLPLRGGPVTPRLHAQIMKKTHRGTTPFTGGIVSDENSLVSLALRGD
jgi:hypothetical protein